MSKIIDLCLDIPPLAEQKVSSILPLFLDSSLVNYKKLYASLYLSAIDAELDDADRILVRDGREAFESYIRAKAEANTPSLEEFISNNRAIGIQWGITNSPDNDNLKTSELIKQFPDDLKGFIFLKEREPMPMVRELEQAVCDYGLHALYITPFRMKCPADDRRLYPVYSKLIELDIPVHFHCSMSAGTDVPYDIGHPRHIDQVAMDFPDLRIMASVGGFPWVNEFLTLPIRHKNLYVNFETHQPEDLIRTGSGMESLLYYSSRVFPDKICFASNWTALGISLEETIVQAGKLPLSEEHLNMLLFENASRFYRNNSSAK